jgi:uncharacterized protein (TIGR03437 family)
MKKLFCYLFALTATVWGQNASPTINQLPTRQFGHPVSENLNTSPTQASPNLVEGREVYLPGQIAFDTTGSSPILYIADIGNNRVLAYKNPGGVTPGKPADLVIGQQDMVSTLAQGPTTAFTTGFNAPTGVAVDNQGRLYVADAGNNRIMRFPAPFSQPAGAPPQPDLVIGQQSFGSGSAANQGGGNVCSNKTVAFSSGGAPNLVSVAIDSNQNLWVTDALNNRVLMYPVANLTAHAVSPVATVVLGQNDFNTCTVASGQNTQLTKTIVVDPSGLAFDSSGNLYVADGFARVLFFQGPNFSAQGQSAARILGIAPPITQGQPTVVYPTNYTLGTLNSAGNPIPPNGVFTNGTNVFVADTPSNRIIEYDVPSKWAPESTAFPSPAALRVFGQNGFAVGKPNQALSQPTSFTISGPYGGAFLGTQMWVSDTGNNRILGIAPDQTGNYSAATVLIGQLDYIYNAPNLIVGSEVNLTTTLGSASGMVVDNSSNPPHLYISDPGNHRILCFSNALIVGQGPGLPAADLVIGQPDLKTSQINYPLGLAGQPTQTGLFNPIGVVVDTNGNLYVADSGNGRVVRFPAPFSQPKGQQPTANLVLGQSDFGSFIQNASANSMHTPWGVALFADVTGATPLAGSIAVSDPFYQRVLIFKKQAGGDFVSGESASIVLGQSSFSGTASGNGAASFSSPRGLAADTSDRLYVADAGNNRVLVFSGAPENGSGATSTSSLTSGLNAPQAVAINATTTELWVASTNNSTVYRFPQYTDCLTQVNCTATAQLSSYGPLALAIDGSGNVIVGDLSNRITFYFALAYYKSAATYSAHQPLAPGMLVVLGRAGQSFSVADAAVQPAPWPTVLSGVSVTVNGTPAPVFSTLSAGAIYFQVPSNAPTSGTANFIVTNTGGAVLAVGQFQMGKSDPGFFTANASGLGQVAAINDDGSVNGPGNGVSRSGTHYISFYLTGQGVVSGAPPDGQGAPGAVNTPIMPTVVMNRIPLDPSLVTYSGLAPGLPGVWQINVTVPSLVPPGNAISITLTMNDIAANIGGNTQSFPDGTPGPDIHQIVTTFATKQ